MDYVRRRLKYDLVFLVIFGSVIYAATHIFAWLGKAEDARLQRLYEHCIERGGTISEGFTGAKCVGIKVPIR